MKQSSINSDDLKKCLLNQCQLCIQAAAVCGKWNETPGSLNATYIVLSAMQDAGDSFFALRDRWEDCENVIFNAFLQLESLLGDIDN
mmetsp:Transcript_48011/g.56092  ORF Transcript_48011/g.56092 Transcript_48011/m.56092 type:complete len:87 (+) Transcript_48011:776-1036(+)